MTNNFNLLLGQVKIKRVGFLEFLYDISTFLFIFTFYSYGFIGIPLYLYRVIMYAFIGIMLFKILVTKKIRTPQYLVWAIPLFLWGILLSINTFSYSSEIVYQILRSTIIGFAICQYLDTPKNFMKLLSSISFSGFFISCYSIIFLSEQLGSERFGGEQFQNANILSLHITLAILIIIWKIYQRKNIIRNIILVTPLIYISFMSGSRKGIITIIIFMLILSIIHQGVSNKIKNLILTSLMIFMGYWAIINIPILYDVIGIRMVQFIGFFDNSFQIDSSAHIRQNLINNGKDYFMQSPIFGHGFNSSITYLGMHSHNNYIEILISGGITLFLLYFSAYLICFVFLLNNKLENKNIKVFIIALLVSNLFTYYGQVMYYLWLDYLILAMAFSYIFNISKWKKQEWGTKGVF